MAEPRQGEIWWAELPSPFRRRPVLVLTRTDAIKSLQNVTVAPLTRTIRYIDAEVVLTPEQGVLTLSAVSLDNIVTVPKSFLDRPIATLTRDVMSQVFHAIRFVFDMPPQ